MKNMKRIALVVAITLLLGCAIGGTLAWLTDETDTVTNTFTSSDIGVQFKETEATYKMIPGGPIDKDPKAWIETGSEPAYLFVEVNESENFDQFMTYKIASGWTLLGTTISGTDINTVENDTYVIYCEVGTDKMGENNASYILNENKVFVKGEVTKEMMDTTKGFTQPTLSFATYAIQSSYLTDQTGEGTVNASDAWKLVKPAN